MLKKFIAAIIAVIMSFSSAAFADSTEPVQQDLDYTDKGETFDNPERGFYSQACWHMKEGGAMPETWKLNYNLVHLRIDISDFSSNAVCDYSKTEVSSEDDVETGESTDSETGRRIVTQTETDDDTVYKIVKTYGESRDITDDALDLLRDTLEYIRSNGHTAILRVCYDRNYEGASNYEPEQEVILQHIEQLSGVFNEYKDVIASVDLGLYGPWGEQHTSTIATRANIAQALDKMLECTDSEIKIAARNPRIIATWLGLSSDSEFDADSDEFKEKAAQKGDDYYRVGLYNDGYLASSTDYGTWDSSITRDNGTKWLNEIGKTVLYGGEPLIDNSGKTDEDGNAVYLNEYNSISGFSVEGFQTHTAYLNPAWDYRLVNAWKEEIYSGDDSVYDGQTAYKYINDHLGYRFVLTNSKLSDGENSGSFKADIELENVGFGNIVNSKELTFVLKNESGDVYELSPETYYDPTKFYSNETASIQTDVSLPSDIEAGEWSVYLRISKNGAYETDNNYQCIRFANDESYWDSTTGSNYVGKINITQKVAEPTEIKVSNVLDTVVNVEYIDGQLYSIDGESWQSSGCFSGLTPDTQYNILTKTTTSDTVLSQSVSTLKSGTDTLISEAVGKAEDDTSIRVFAAVGDNKYDKNGFVISSDKHNSVILENNTLYTLADGKEAASYLTGGKYFVTAQINNIPSSDEKISVKPFVVVDDTVYYAQSSEMSIGGLEDEENV